LSSSQDALKQLDESPISGFQLKTVITAGMGFFTDAYDLFIIGVVSDILKTTWNIDKFEISVLSSVALLSAALGAVVFGRIADRMGRKFVYGYELLVLAAGAIASALAPNVMWLIIFRFVLGVGVGGDYPVSSTLMSEYANRRDRGKLMTLVFSTQALGLILGPLLTFIMAAIGVNHDLIWRILLGVGAIPALSTFWLRRQIAESPRFSLSQGDQKGAEHAVSMARGEKGDAVEASDKSESPASRQTVSQDQQKIKWQDLFTTRHWLIWIIGTAGTWFLLDFAYYGTTVSTATVVKLLSPKATLAIQMLYTLLIFVVAALPGYIVAALTIDRIGRKPIQLLGFAMMTLAYATFFFFPQITSLIVPFLIFYGLSYFFSEFGPNVTTFLYPAEIFPVSVRSTAHGFSAGVAKIGAFVGAFLIPFLISTASFKLPGALGVAALVTLAGFLLTFVLPEPNQKSLETIEKEGNEMDQEVEEKASAAQSGTNS
jgi:PHS family inorganic phosphate transporter-like MFS transporter